MHAGVRADMRRELRRHQPDRRPRTSPRGTTRKAAMVKAQIVPAFCTLPEAVEAAVAELQRISRRAPGERAARRSRHARVRRAAAGAAGRRQVVALRARRPALVPRLRARGRTARRGRHASHAAPRPGSASNGSSPGTRRRSRAGSCSRFSNRFILIDTGMLTTFFKSGRASALELQDGRITAIYTDSRTPIVAVGPVIPARGLRRLTSPSLRPGLGDRGVRRPPSPTRRDS